MAGNKRLATTIVDQDSVDQAVGVDAVGASYALLVKAVASGAGLVPEDYDYIALTYVAAGNGAGEIETVTYKTGGSGGTTVATLTLTYDANDNISTITKS